MNGDINKVHEQLYISSIGAARTVPMQRFDAVITVCQDDIEDHIPEGVEYHFFKMADGPCTEDLYGGRHDYEFFEYAATTALRHIDNGDTILIHCHRGASRSVSVSISALAIHDNTGYHEMYGRVRDNRSQANPDELLVSHAKKFIEKQSDMSEAERFK